jgi:hypothetical protein
MPADAQSVGDPIDVIEPGGNQRDLQDPAIVETRFPQTGMVLPAHAGGIEGELCHVVEQDSVGGLEGRGPVIALDRFDQRGIETDLTQKLCVRLDSIEAAVLHRDEHRDHLVLPPRQRQIGRHQQ